MAAGAAAAAAVGNAIGARRVPGHADHQAAVMAPVSRPPFLTVGHESGKVSLERGKVEMLDLFAIIETLQRVGFSVVLVENIEVQRIRPPGHGRRADG